MYLFFLIVLVITGATSALDILIGLKGLNEEIKLLVNFSNILFFVSLLFFVFKSGTRHKL
ncbi:hypothetical protein ACQCT3_02440 [Sutcliffiella horikoshii]|uniref:hypothetical protein n=1 Tax=Sutcliffiella horikoshii TaxID=79883 RepID=UPI003CF96625